MNYGVMRTIAASSAALAVATGFDAGTSSETGEVSAEDGVDHEKNWTKKHKTDDLTFTGDAWDWIR